MMKQTSMILMALVICCMACSEEDGNQPTVRQDDQIAVDSISATVGTFTGYEHGLQGIAYVITSDDGKRTLRFENYYMQPGPDVHVLLSTSNNYSAANTVEVTMLNSGFTDSNINFPLDNVIYSDEHKFVLVYCVRFNSLFGFAELN